ncbi:Autophagy-related protein 33 like [Verticillium longisporum]|uniref:Autophagy-related protein 33 like n=2 Tax=Verticillium longisporum TaxID=100787 RepID=A0A8I2ZRZ3_VERLO|nr:Autophagy-related protein 33 like [Verticillium longisporum]
MASRGVSALKFVGTVSLGLLTGLSYSLSAVTVPSILALPSASDAVRAFENLTSSSTLQLRALTGISTASFLLAFFLSPRAFRHPYLVYASAFALTSSLAEQIASRSLAADSSSHEAAHANLAARRERRAARNAARNAARTARMEASYEVVGDSHSDGTGSVSGAEDLDAEEEALNGEQVRGEVEAFGKTQLVQAGVASVGFLMAVVGIWGEGATHVF